MKKLILATGICILAAGVLLSVLSNVYIPKTITEEYQVPKSSVIFGGWGPLIVTSAKTGGKGTYLNASDLLNIQVNATLGKGIDFYVNAVNQSTNDVLATYLFYPDVTSVNTDWVVPLSSEYNFEFSSNSLFTRDDVSLLVTKQWTETAYRDMTENYSLLPFEATYVGILLVIVGITVTIYGIVMRKSALATVP
jgi:hypothetical protein